MRVFRSRAYTCSVVALLAAMGITICFTATGRAAQRPPVIGRTAGASAGHPLTTAAAIDILQKGGNAFDAGVAALLVGGVVEQDLYSLGGEALGTRVPETDAQGAGRRRARLGTEGCHDRVCTWLKGKRWTVRA